MLRILTSTLPPFLAGGLIGPPLAASTSPLAAAFLAVALGTSLAVLARRVGASESHPALVATAALVGFLHTLPPSPQPIHGIDEPMCELRGRITHRMDGRFGTRVIVGEAAARALTLTGQLFLVANRHLPYEKDLTNLFRDVEEIGGTSGFKVLHASRVLKGTKPPARGR